MSHTPERWRTNGRVNRYGNILVDTPKNVICRISVDDFDDNTEMAKANARLITMAPRLLETLVDLMHSLEGQRDRFEKDNSEYMILSENIRTIKKAILKATA